MARGLERSGRIVTSAAAIVVLVAGSFAFADVVLIKALGLGVALAVALDATVVRALLVPSTMRLLGRWNWWMPDRCVVGWVRGAGAGRMSAVRGIALAASWPARCVVAAGCGGPILAQPAAHARRHLRPSPTPTPVAA